MNLPVHHVLADISGQTGTAIVAAILAGQGDPAVLAPHRDKRVKASEATLVNALTGDYRAEHLFCLSPAFAGHQFVRKQITEHYRRPVPGSAAPPSSPRWPTSSRASSMACPRREPYRTELHRHR